MTPRASWRPERGKMQREDRPGLPRKLGVGRADHPARALVSWGEGAGLCVCLLWGTPRPKLPI